MKTVAIMSRRNAIQTTLPMAMSREPIGVACIAWKTRLHRSPLMIGKVASNAADCMHVAASRPGARNCRYDTPPSAAVSAALSTYDPRPSPIAVRNSTGLTGTS